MKMIAIKDDDNSNNNNDIPSTDLIYKSYNIAKERASELSKLYQSTSKGGNKGHLLLAQRSYKALSTILYASISITQIEELERFIKKSSVRLPVGLFDLDEWITAINASLEYRTKEIKRIASSYIDDDIKDLKKSLIELTTEAEEKMFTMKNDIKNVQKQLMPILKADEAKIKTLEYNNRLLKDEISRLATVNKPSSPNKLNINRVETLEKQLAIEENKNKILNDEINKLNENIKNNEFNSNDLLSKLEYQKNELNEQFEAKKSQLIQMYDDKIQSMMKQHQNELNNQENLYKSNLNISIEKVMKENNDKVTSRIISIENDYNLKLKEHENNHSNQLSKYQSDIIQLDKEKTRLLAELESVTSTHYHVDNQRKSDIQSLEDALKHEKENHEQKSIENTNLLEEIERLKTQHNMEIIQLQLLDDNNIQQIADKVDNDVAALKASNDDIIKRLIASSEEKDSMIATLQQQISFFEQLNKQSTINNDSAKEYITNLKAEVFSQTDLLEATILDKGSQLNNLMQLRDAYIEQASIDTQVGDLHGNRDSVEAALKSQIHDLQSQLREMSLIKESMSSQLEEQSAQLQAQTVQLQNAIDAKGSLQSLFDRRVAELTAQIQDAYNEELSLHTEIEDLNRQLQELKSSSKDSIQPQDETADKQSLDNQVKDSNVDSSLQAASESQIHDLQLQLREINFANELLSNQLEAKSEQLEFQAAQLQNAVDAKDSLQSVLDSRVAELTAQIQEAYADKESLKFSMNTEIEDLNRLLQESKSSKDSIQALLDATLAGDGVKYADEIAKYLSQVCELSSQVEEIKAAKDSLQAALGSQISELTSQLREMTSIKESLTSQLESQAAQFELQAEQLHGALTAKSSLQSSLDGQVANLTSQLIEYASLKVELAEVKAAKQSLEEAYVLKTTEESKVSNDNSDNVTLEVSKLSNELEEARNTIETLNREIKDISSVKESLSSSENQVQGLHNQLQQATSDVERLTLQLTEESSLSTKLKFENDAMNTTIADLKKQLNTFEVNFKEVEIVNEDFKCQLEATKSNVEQMGVQLLEAKTDKEKAESLLKGLEANDIALKQSNDATISDLTQTVKSLESKVETLEGTVTELRAINNDTSHQLSTANSSKLAVDKMLSSMMTVNATLENTIKSLTSSVETMTAKIPPLEDTVISQKEQIENLRTSLSDAEAKLGIRHFDMNSTIITAACKIQAKFRGWVLKKNYKQYMLELIAIRSGVLAAKKYTIQGQSGWYKAPDELIYYFTQEDGTWIQIYGPITEEEYIITVQNSFKKKKTLTMTKVDFDLLIPIDGYQVCIDEVDKKLYVCTPLEALTN